MMILQLRLKSDILIVYKLGVNNRVVMSVTTKKLSYFIADSAGKKMCLLHSVSVSFPASSVTCILGPSGAG